MRDLRAHILCSQLVLGLQCECFNAFAYFVKGEKASPVLRVHCEATEFVTLSETPQRKLTCVIQSIMHFFDTLDNRKYRLNHVSFQFLGLSIHWRL